MRCYGADKVVALQIKIWARFLNAERLSGFEKRNYSLFSITNINNGLNISQFDQYKRDGDNYAYQPLHLLYLKNGWI